MSDLKHAILRGALGLGAFAVLTAGAIAVTQQGTFDRIADQKRQARAAALHEVMPSALHDNDLLETTVALPGSPELGITPGTEGWLATNAGKPVAIILPVVAAEGYSGPIRMIVGIDRAGVITGVRVLEHKETPGLGDRIDLRKSNWILGFNGKSLENPDNDGWRVVKDGGAFDQFTGATITPRAVVSTVHRSLNYYREHQGVLMGNPATPSNAGASVHE